MTFKAVFAFNVQQPAPPDSFYAVPPSLTNDESDIYIYIYILHIYMHIYILQCSGVGIDHALLTRRLKSSYV